MSYASQLTIPSQGSLGQNFSSGAFVAVPLATGVAQNISNTLYVEEGAYILQRQVVFTTNADNTTEIDSLVLTITNEAGLIVSTNLITNPAGAGAYASQTISFTTSAPSVSTSTSNNEFTASIIWNGAGSAPACSCLLNALKVV